MTGTPLGRRLQSLRENEGMTQSELGDKAGLHAMHISHFECGRRLPSIPNAIKLCEALGCSMDWLTRGVEHER